MKKNVVFLLIDALRPSNMGCYGYDKNTTPNIDKLAKESIVFDNFFSTANATDPCVTSIFTGRYPWHNGIVSHGINMNHEQVKKFMKMKNPWLPKILQEKGYATASFDWLGRWHRNGFDYYMGIDPYNNKITKIIRTIKNLRTRVFYENGEFITNKAINFMNKCENKPFFIFMHFWDTHTPYNPPKRILKNFKNIKYTNKTFLDLPKTVHGEWIKKLRIKSLNEVFARYDSSINYVDNQIGRIINFLKDKGIYNNTLIIVTADHGENLMEHGVLFNHSEIYDTTLKIPLVLKIPQISHRRVSAMVQQVDIFPTILECFNIEQSKKTDGKSFFKNLSQDFKRFRDYIPAVHVRGEKVAFRDNKHKFISSIDKKNKELYDLSKDKYETINIINNNNYKKFEKILEQSTIYSSGNKDFDVINEQRKRLKIDNPKKGKRGSALRLNEIRENQFFAKVFFLTKILTLTKMFFKRPLGVLLSLSLTTFLWLLLAIKMGNSKNIVAKQKTKLKTKYEKLLSVVIVNWNCEKILEECLKAVYAYLPKNSEVIVVDNSSYDSSVAMIKNKFPKTKLILNKHNEGFAKANNQAFQIAKGKYIMALNPDAVVTKGFFEKLIKVMESDNKIGTVGPKLMNMTKRNKIDTTGHIIYKNRFATNRGLREDDNNQYKSGEVFGICAAAALYRKDMLEDIKINGEYFDEDYFCYFEDVDLDWRAQKAGWKSYFTNNAIAYHYRELLSNYEFRYKMSLRNRYFTIIKNDSFGSLMRKFFAIFPSEVYYNSLRPGIFLKTYKEILKLIPKMAEKRKQIQQKIGGEGQSIEKWFEKFPLKNETSNRHR